MTDLETRELLSCRLTDSEIGRYSAELSGLVLGLEELEEEARETAKEFREQIKARKKSQTALASKIRSRSEVRAVNRWSRDLARRPTRRIRGFIMNFRLPRADNNHDRRAIGANAPNLGSRQSFVSPAPRMSACSGPIGPACGWATGLFLGAGECV